MYLVKIYDRPTDLVGTTIHSPYTNGPKLSAGNIQMKLSGIDEFTFIITINNPGYKKIKPIATLIKVFNISKNKVVFEGRILRPTYSMQSDGYFSQKYICESKLAYLHDSSQRFLEIHNTSIRDFFALMINRHNNTVEPYKQFKVGKVTVTNTTDNVYRFLSYDKTYPSIKEKLIDRLGGFLVLRNENDGCYIDYLDTVGSQKTTRISIRKNLKSIVRDIDPTNIITRLVPLGATLNVEGESNVSSPRITIESVNGGKDYLDDLELQSEFGVIEGEVTWDDVNLPNILLNRGKDFLKNQKPVVEAYQIDAVDLSTIDLSIDGFRIGDWHFIDNPLVLPDESLQIIEMNIDLLIPHNSNLIFGDKQKTLTQYQSEFNQSQKSIVNLRTTVNQQNKRISTLSSELETTKEALQKTQQSLEDFEGNTSEGMVAITDAILSIDNAINDLTEIVDGLQGVITIEEKQQMQEAIAKNILDILTMNDQIINLTNRVVKLEGGGGEIG